MDNQDRIYGDQIDLPELGVKSFFKERSTRSDSDNPYISVLYQDKNPELAISRDRHEKEKILPLLRLSKTDDVMDVGCGIGRWAEGLYDQVRSYTGIDLDEGLISIAKSYFQQYPACHFYCLSADQVNAPPVCARGPFSLLIVSGVLLYLNDSAIVQFFSNCRQLLRSGANLYIREPLAINNRLTLNGVWSDDLEQEYYAIYRTKAELSYLIDEGLQCGLERMDFLPLYDDENLNNRAETRQFYSIFSLE